jgi:hypothetical protein
MRARRSPEQWSAFLDELSESGESVESFCRSLREKLDHLDRLHETIDAPARP